jgi:hypothetical protein
LTPPVATVSVSEVKGKTVKIQAGATAGVTVGSIYHQHPENRASLKITKVGTFESEGTASGRFKLGDNVLEKSHAYHFDPIKVYLAADYPHTRSTLIT